VRGRRLVKEEEEEGEDTILATSFLLLVVSSFHLLANQAQIQELIAATKQLEFLDPA